MLRFLLSSIVARSIVAFLLSLFIVLLFQPIFIKWFRAKKMSQPIRDDGPQAHALKQGTPTMGGLVIVLSVMISTLLFADLSNIYVWLMLIVIGGYGILGFVDDFSKLKDRSSKGISARTKLYSQFGLAVLLVSILVFFVPGFSTEVSLPFASSYSFDLSYFYILFGAIIIVGASNAVNLTDGLDGLAIVPIMAVACAYGIFAYVAGHAKIAEYLQIVGISGAGDLSIIASALIAGGMGFLWFNAFPAQIFLGDVGALSMGGALGMLAVIVKNELLLVIAGGIFVVEALSVIIQVVSFKTRGKRVFKMAPLHHHFELKGMAEPKIIVRAWIISFILAIISIASLMPIGRG